MARRIKRKGGVSIISDLDMIVKNINRFKKCWLRTFLKVYIFASLEVKLEERSLYSFEMKCLKILLPPSRIG